MQIWVDADACPKAIREILFRAAGRTHTKTTLVANHYLTTPPSPHIKFLQVEPGFDAADLEIVKRVRPGDLVVTGDIPLASDVIDKGGHVIDPRGESYTRDNIEERLNMRELLETLRAGGVETGGPAPLSARDIQAFANRFDRFLVEQGLNKSP